MHYLEAERLLNAIDTLIQARVREMRMGHAPGRTAHQVYTSSVVTARVALLEVLNKLRA